MEGILEYTGEKLLESSHVLPKSSNLHFIALFSHRAFTSPCSSLSVSFRIPKATPCGL